MRAFLTARKHSVLLVTAILAESLQAYATGLLPGILYDSLVALLLLTVFLVVLDEPRQRTIGLLLAIPALVTNWLHYGLRDSVVLPLEFLHHVFMFAFFLFAAFAILRNVFRRREVSLDGVLAAVCGYLLAGAAFGNLYTVVELLHPGSFNFNSPIVQELHNWHSRRFLFGYFSLVTITSMGYGDVTPVSPAAASLTWMEAVFGQFYLAVVVAQLVGMRIILESSGKPPPGDVKR
jgi:Ion channel